MNTETEINLTWEEGSSDTTYEQGNDAETICVEKTLDINELSDAQQWAAVELAVMFEELFGETVFELPALEGETFEEQQRYLILQATAKSSSISTGDVGDVDVREQAMCAARWWLYVAWWSEYGHEFLYRNE